MATVYVPTLRWKRGEVRAVENLKSTTQEQIIPLVDLMPHSFDPIEEDGGDTAFEQRLSADAASLKRARGSRIAWVDLSDLDPAAVADGKHFVDFFFGLAASEGCQAIPVIQLDADSDYRSATHTVAKRDDRGAVCRISVPDFEDGDYSDALEKLKEDLDLDAAEIDIVIDMRAGVTPIPAQSRIARAILADIPDIDSWRSIVLSGGAFLRDLSSMAPGTHLLSRDDWHLWKHVESHNPARNLIFGDYTTRHPELADDVDPRLLNMSASIRYTLDDDWLVLRGRGLRTPGAGGYDQYRTHARRLVAMPEYSGATFSWGDQRIEEIAKRPVKPGNPETWISISINHHIEFVVEQVSNLGGA